MDVNFKVPTSAEKIMTIPQSPSVSSPTATRSPWHSPVPYLFGGLAAMLGLIAFALLILACSYWRLSGNLEGGSNNEGDLEAGAGDAGESNEEEGSDGQRKKPALTPIFVEKFLVFMPGQNSPTFLATPMSSRASSFGSTNSSNSSCSTENTEKSQGESEEKKPGNGINQVEMVNLDVHQETRNQDHQV